MAHAESKTNKPSLSPDEATLIDSAGQDTSFDLAAMLDSISDAFICIDRHWRCSYVNAQAEHIFRRKREELLGKDVWEVWPTKIGSTFYQKAHEVVEKQVSLDYTDHDLLQQWLSVRISPAQDGITVFLQNVTERKHTEEQQEFDSIAEHASDFIARFDSAYCHLYVNPAIEAATGLPSHAFIGKTNEELGMPAHLLERWRSALHTVFTTGQEAFIEFEFPSPAGSTWFESHLVPEFAQHGTVVSVLVISRDITERKRLEAELHTAKEQLEAILYNVDDGIMVQDATGKIIFANLAAARLVGCISVEELLQAPGLPYLERLNITDEQGHPLSAATLPGRRAMQGEAPAQLTIRFVNKETQEVRWARLKSTAISATDHVPALVITVIQDITQFKELEQRKDGFIMNVSHELRTPLTALNGYLELLKEHDKQLDPPMKAMFLQQAMENCNELTRLINTILDALQTSNAVQPAQREALSVAQTVREVLAQFDPQKKQAYALQVQIPEQLTVWADLHALQQVLRNLLSNAFKYAPQQTSIILSATRREETRRAEEAAYVCICVQDAGSGIPLSEQPLLFQKFMRLKRDLSGTVRGTGLGLYISKQLVEAMGGDIWVESSGRQGEGSRFCFTLLEASRSST